MSANDGAPLVNAATAILSMRSSSFDELSAYGEVVDNSIQAEAKNIKIKFDTTTRDIRKLAFGDDGIGMNAETLSKCLSLGWSSRYNDREGIGRFGVGMKLGAIHQCKRVEVWSKQSGAGWLYTYIDLDEIEQGTMGLIPFQSLKNLHRNSHHWLEANKGRSLCGANTTTSGCAFLNYSPKSLRAAFRYFIWNEGPQGEQIRPHP